MNILNEQVIHKTLGIGIVKEQNGKYITVEFAKKTGTFQYPEIFRTYLTAVDKVVMSEIIDNENKRTEEKQIVDSIRKKEAKKKLEELEQKHGYKNQRKIIKRIEGIDGQKRTFLQHENNYLLNYEFIKEILTLINTSADCGLGSAISALYWIIKLFEGLPI